MAYIQAKLPDKNYDIENLMADLVKYNMKPDSLPGEAVETFSTVAQIAGKTIRTLFNGLSLLKLSPELQTAVSEGTLPVSQGYLFAANLDCPDRDKIFEAVMEASVTYHTLERLLTAWKKVKPAPGATKPLPMTKHVAGLRSIESRIQTGIATYTKPDLVTLLDELNVFRALIELRIAIAPEPAPEKKRPPQL